MLMTAEYPAEPAGHLDQTGPRAKTVKAFCRDWPVSKSKFYELVSTGKLRAVKIAGRTVVLAEDERRFVESLPTIGK